MKTAKEWVDENSQSGAFDIIDGYDEAIQLIEDVRKEAVEAFLRGEYSLPLPPDYMKGIQT